MNGFLAATGGTKAAATGAAVAVAVLLLLSGCGGSGGGGGDLGPPETVNLEGQWRVMQVAAGDAAGGEAVTDCPGQAQTPSGAAEAVCGRTDSITFTGSTFVQESTLANGQRTRERGTFTRNADRITIRIIDSATDVNGDGTFSDAETEVFPVNAQPSFPGRIGVADGRRLLIVLDLGDTSAGVGLERI